MAVCTEFVGGYLMQTSDSLDACTGYVLSTATEYASYFDAFSLDAEQITYAIGFGFGVVAFAYFLGYPIGIAKKMINKA